MAGGKFAAALIDDGSLQCLGQFNEVFIPAAVRARRSAMMTVFVATSNFAASATAPDHPVGRRSSDSAEREAGFLGERAFRSSLSATINTRPIAVASS
jgi:hypothetical protein